MRFLGALAAVTVLLAGSPALAQAQSEDCPELVVYNGKIVTMDGRNTIASSVTMRNDRIVAVGTGSGVPAHAACATLIDLRGRTVIPGLIDNHDHPIALGLRPGYDTRLDTAASIADVQSLIRLRAAAVPPGQWITAIGGWNPVQLAEKRLPTLAELDAAAASHPLFLWPSGAFTSPAGSSVTTATNARGKTLLEAKGIAVSADGGISNESRNAALTVLRAEQTFDDRKRGTADALAYFARMGLTTHLDMGGAWPASPAWNGAVETSDGGLSFLDPVAGYEPVLALHREGTLPVRLRIFFYSQDLKPDAPFLAQRLNNQLIGLGDDWVKVSGVGERITGGDVTRQSAQYEAALRLVAERGWSYQQHVNGLQDARAITAVWEKVNAAIPLAPLRWTLAHVYGIDRDTLDRLKAIGAGVSVGGGRYFNRAGQDPPFRTIVESGIHAGYGGDGPNPAPVNPWVHMSYMVTGRNAAGESMAAGQTLSRLQALRLYTIDGAWFSGEENALGSIEVGKRADVAVLSGDFLDPARVPDEAIKGITSVLTIVGGRVVHGGGITSAPFPRITITATQ